jgi:hypothetical protein
MTRLGRIAVPLLLALAGMVGHPAGASADSRQFSIIEDDAVFLGLTPRDPDAALAESKALGADAVRVVLSWRRVSPNYAQPDKPTGFDVADPDSDGYDWSGYDRLVGSARRHGLKVILDLSPQLPYWGSSDPKGCPHFVAGKPKLGLGCYWKPSPRIFGKFASAAAKRYRHKVAYYSLYNEPNLENYLYPQAQKTKAGTVDLAGRTLRGLWIDGYRSIRKADPAMRNRVLFGETAAISSPRDTLYSALCLNRRGRPYTGRMKKLQGCSKPGRLPIGGLAVHPYNRSALGTVFTRTSTKASMTMGYLGRATRLLRNAEKYKRIPKGRGIFVTETGFQSNPPDPRGLTPDVQARSINEADRLFFGDRRIRSTAQFELFDVPDEPGQDIFNTGLRMFDGTAKPSLAAYRMPLVVTRLSANRVEVWGQVRPAKGRVRAAVSAASSPAGPFTGVRSPRTNAAGYFRFVLRRRGAAKLQYRSTWHGRTSRTATAGRPIRYREKP